MVTADRPRTLWQALNPWPRALLVVLTCLLPALATAEVTLEVTPDPIVANQSCQLVFKVVGDGGEPDFAPLEPYFEILGRNRQTSIRWINGRREDSTTWVLSAMPRAPGRIEIPPITFGNEQSPARAVEIVATPAADRPAQADVLLEVDAEPSNPYVQQQVIYTIRLLHRVDLSSPRFSPITASADAIIKPLGDGSQSTRRIDGITYEVLEQRYAVFPQQSGRLVIEPLVLTTQIVNGRRSLFDPFSQSLQTRRVESEAVALDVRPVPAGFPADATWLPARRLRLHEEWEPDATTAESGVPLSRTLFLWADGLVSGQLPKLELAAPPGLKVYPDQAQSNEQDTANGFTAVQQQKFAIIAGKPGSQRFAALSLPWWNTDTDRLEMATLPARTLEFRPAGGAGTNTTPPADAGRAMTEATTEGGAAAGSVDGDAAAADGDAASATPVTRAAGSDAAVRGWMIASGVLAAGWLATLLAWWHRTRRGAGGGDARPRRADDHAARTSDARAGRELKQACARDDAPAARAALIAWARGRHPAAACRSLRDVTTLAATPALREAVVELERALYGRAARDWRGETLWHAFQREPRAAASAGAARAPVLPPLFKLGSAPE